MDKEINLFPNFLAEPLVLSAAVLQQGTNMVNAFSEGAIWDGLHLCGCQGFEHSSKKFDEIAVCCSEL